MTNSITVKIDPQLLQRIARIQNADSTIIKPAITAGLAVLQDDISEYFPKKKGAFSRLATPRQRRAYWAKVKSGEARHDDNGYVRTNHTGRKWTTAVNRKGRGVVGILGNNAPAAKWMHSAKHQQKFHAETGFRTDEEVVKDNERKVLQIFDAHVRRAIR